MIELEAPQLRLEGFHAAWEPRTVGSLAKIGSGRDYKHLNAGDIPVYGTGGYMLSVDQALSYSNDAIGIGRKGTIDNPYIIRAPFWTVDTLFYVIPHRETDIQFLQAHFEQVDWRSKDESTGVPSLSKQTIANTVVCVTETLQQQAIGSVFSHLDSVLNQHRRKLQQLQQTKSALMQRMFTQDDADEPELRFKEFMGPWREVRLGDVAHFTNGRAFSQAELLDSGKYPVLRVGNFYTNSAWYYSDLELDEKLYANTGNLLYTWSASFGPHIWTGAKVIYHYHIWKVETAPALDKIFALHLLHKDRERILAGLNGSTMAHITKEGMEDKRVIIPTDLEEQQAIGAVFTKFDSLISAEQHYIDKLQQVKAGLLQKMFI